MISIKDQLHNILLGHLGKLSGKDVFEVQQEFEVIVGLVITDHSKGDLVGLFLLLSCTIACHEAQANILPRGSGTSPCMPTKLLGFYFYYSIMPLCYVKYHMNQPKLNNQIP